MAKKPPKIKKPMLLGPPVFVKPKAKKRKHSAGNQIRVPPCDGADTGVSMVKSKTHKVVVTMLFENSCTKKQALKLARDSICRSNRPTTGFHTKDPEKYDIGSVELVAGRLG